MLQIVIIGSYAIGNKVQYTHSRIVDIYAQHSVLEPQLYLLTKRLHTILFSLWYGRNISELYNIDLIDNICYVNGWMDV